MRRNKTMRMIGLFASYALLASCATPASTYPIISQSEISAREAAVQSLAVNEALARNARVWRVAWPILAKNAELCADQTMPNYGLRIGNDRSLRDQIDGFNLRQVRALGYSQAPLILAVAPTSPAGKAGLKQGDEIVQIGGTDIDGDMATLTQLLSEDRKMREDQETAQPLVLGIRRGGDAHEVALMPETICKVSITTTPQSTINASAAGRSITLHAGLIRLLDNDRDLAFVFAHELGHVIGSHTRKLLVNAGTSGFVIWGVPLSIAAQLVDFVIAPPLERLAGVEDPPATQVVSQLSTAALRTRAFEREADYLGLYMLARAGFDLAGAEHTFEAFSKDSPRSTYGTRTHPVTPERILSVEKTRSEIKAKQAGEEPLLPEGWPSSD